MKLPEMSNKPNQMRALIQSLEIEASDPLYSKAHKIVENMIQLWENNGGHFLKSDVDMMQEQILETLSPEDFKRIAKLSFTTWASPERLSGSGISHLNAINRLLAQHIKVLVRNQGNITQVAILDLGGGILGTTAAIVEELAPLGHDIHITAIDSTPKLIDAAQVKAKTLIHEFPILHLQLVEADMLAHLENVSASSCDYVVICFAIHHLHPSEQELVVQEAMRVLKTSGALLIADPQEGKSDFNLNTLMYEEPESVFAAFTSPDQIKDLMLQEGFNPIEVLARDDQGFTAYAISGSKSQ